MGEVFLNQSMRLRNHLVIAAEIFATEENFSPVLIPTLFNEMDEQLKLAHKVIDIVDRANKKICVTLLRYSVDKPVSFYVQDRLFAVKKEDEYFQQIAFVNFKLEEMINLLDAMTSAYDKVLVNQPTCSFL